MKAIMAAVPGDGTYNSPRSRELLGWHRPFRDGGIPHTLHGRRIMETCSCGDDKTGRRSRCFSGFGCCIGADQHDVFVVVPRMAATINPSHLD